MKRFLPKLASAPQQRGVSVIAALFLLLLMSLLAALMANMLNVTNVNMAADVGGSRAYQAARAGVEWGMFKLDPDAQSSSLPSGLPTCGGVVAPFPVIPGHNLNVSCQPYPSDTTVYQEGSRQIRIFRIISTATANDVKLPGIQREVMVTIEKCRDTAIASAPYDC